MVQSMGLQRVGHNLATEKQQIYIYTHTYIYVYIYNVKWWVKNKAEATGSDRKAVAILETPLRGDTCHQAS